MTNNANEPAYPCHFANSDSHNGLTKREAFAIAVAPAFVSKLEVGDIQKHGVEWAISQSVALSFKLADAMLAEAEKGRK